MQDHIYSALHALTVFKRRWFVSRPTSSPTKTEGFDFEDYLWGLQERLWNGRFLQGSTGHFRQLWVRDLGLFCREYIAMGYSERLEKSLDWALSIFKAHGSVTTTIWPNGKAYNVFGYSADAFPLILWTLHHLKAESSFIKYRDFLAAESSRYQKRCFDQDGFTQKNLDLCGLKDAVVRRASAYTFSMNFLFDQMCDRWGLMPRLHSDEEWKQEFLSRYQSKEGFFHEDISRSEVVSADAQLIPYWLGLLDSRDFVEPLWNVLKRYSLDAPTLILQTSCRKASQERMISRLTAPNYQGDTVWANLGAIALVLGTRQGEDVKKYLDQWSRLTQRDGELMELYNADLSPYKSFFYRSDEGMNWSIGYLYSMAQSNVSKT